MLSGELLTLAELARSEAKRRGEPPTALALARVLASREPELFDELFGKDAARTVRAAPAATSQLPSVEQILERAQDGSLRSAIEGLRDSLGPLSAWLSAADAATAPEDKRTIDNRAQSATQADHPLIEPVEPQPVAPGHHQAVTEIIAQLARRVPGNPLVVGPSGSGRTTLAGGLATALAAAPPPAIAGTRVVRLPIDRLLRSEPVGSMTAAIGALEDRDIAFIDDLEALLGLATGAFFGQLAMRLRVLLERPDRRVVLALDQAYRSRLEGADRDLFDELVEIALPTLPRADLEAILEREATALSAYHNVQIPKEVIRLSLAPPPEAAGRAHPGLAIDRLDAACARAVLHGRRTAAEEDLGLQSTPAVAPLAINDLLIRVGEEIRGQDRSLNRVVRRLALTRARLDLRPERPDAVLLLVGPTGVGKTQLARTLCRELFGDEQRMIRLDMSEYADSWAISRLIGPHPGYVGFSEPDAWLTSRIRHQPQTVLLLDEIEKAHPAVWNTFLQVFDAGRLTDPRGNVADFADTVIIMTSNIGSEAFGSPRIGFSAIDPEQEREDEEQRVLAAVHATMRPELINRLDDIIVFSPLSEASILEIAARETARITERLSERGYQAEVGPGVVELIARHGYDPKSGARHLQRNLEQLLLMPLAAVTTRSVRAELDGESIVWREP